MVTSSTPTTASTTPEEGALKTARGIISLFGTFLDSRTTGKVDRPISDEWKSLVGQLQDTNLLSMPLLPEGLRIALGHIDGEDPERSLGYIREAFVRACTFVRAHTMA